MSDEKILIAEDDYELMEQWVEKFRVEKFEVIPAYDCDTAVRLIDSEQPIVALVDYEMPGKEFKNGLEVIREMRRRRSDCAMIMLTGQGFPRLVMETAMAGGFDYKVKPVPFTDLVSLIRTAIARRNDQWVDWPQEKNSTTNRSDFSIVGYSPEMRDLLARIGREAKSDNNLLILGETGSGKELVARAIHDHSGREGNFVEVNCSAIPESLAESLLFGIGKGVGTGVTPRTGYFIAADRGTLFLDEIGDLDTKQQPKILKALEDRAITPIGSYTPIPVDVRLIAATNKNLEDAMKHGNFRADLFTRLAGDRINVPPLRKRREDIPELVRTFMKKRPASRISHAAMQKLRAHDWPCNVRELENVIKRALSESKDGNITAQDIILGPSRDTKSWADSVPLNLTLEEAQQAVLEALVAKLMEETNGNQSEVARRLAGNDPNHTGSRTTVLNTLRVLAARGVKVTGWPRETRKSVDQPPEGVPSSGTVPL